MLQSSLQNAAVLSMPLGADFRKNACTPWYRSTHEAKDSATKTSVILGPSKPWKMYKCPLQLETPKALGRVSCGGPGSCRPHMGRCATLNPNV